MDINKHPLFEKKLEELLNLHKIKSEQYGLKNLYRMGPSYMVMRIIDKSGRLEGFLRGKISASHLKEELRDTAVCSLLALCLIEENDKLYVFSEYKEDNK
jgi:hypothetical protein